MLSSKSQLDMKIEHIKTFSIHAEILLNAVNASWYRQSLGSYCICRNLMPE